MPKSDRLRPWLVANSLVLFAFVAWWAFSATVPEYVLPGPQKVFPKVLELFIDMSMAEHVYISLMRVLASTGLALLLGLGMVIIARQIPVLHMAVEDRLIPMLNSFPSLGWAILGIIWFGVGNKAVIFIETAILAPFAIINLWEGMKVLDAEVLEMARSFTRSRWRVTSKVVLPLLFPYLFAALRMSYGVGWKVSLVAELFGTSSGLGYLMNLARQNFDMPLVVACIVVIIILVAAVDKFVLQGIQNLIQARSGITVPRKAGKPNGEEPGAPELQA